MNKIDRIKELTNELLQYCHEYYDLDSPTISDKEYDKKYDELFKLEEENNFYLATSPTRNVQGGVVEGFKKIEHSKPMLSASKTKDINEIKKFLDNDDFYCSYKLDGCFTSRNRVTMADGSLRNINKVKVGEYVLSCSPDGVVQPKKVVNVFNNGLKKQEEWMKIYTTRGTLQTKNDFPCRNSGTECTKTHLFFTKDGYKKAYELKEGDAIYIPHIQTSNLQNQVLLGTLLGDGYFLKRSKSFPNILEIHTSKTKHDNYNVMIELFQQLFSKLNPKISYRTSGYSNEDNNMIDINLHNIALPNYFTNEQNILRCGLTFTNDILTQMTPLSWAIFFIDDGSLISSQKEGKNVTNLTAGAMLHTNRHKKENVKVLSNYLKSIGINNYISLEKEVVNPNLGDGYVIRISSKDSYKFFKMISPYIPMVLRKKKLPNENEFQNCDEIRWWEEDDSYIGLTEELISKVVFPQFQKQHSKYAYDLEIEDNHNYFVNNHLVHNCTLVTKYAHGHFIQAITRGTGLIGEDVTEQAKMISNLPINIPYDGDLELRGECVISWKQFHKVNETLEDPYSHPRNLAAGTLRNLDTNIVRDRKLSYVVFECVSDLYDEDTLFNSKYDELSYLKDVVGFEVVGRCYGNVDDCVEAMQPDWYEYPVDGLVFEFCDKTYSKSLSATSHHEGCRMALKWEDVVCETTLRDVEWNTTRTGLISPVAVFDEIDLDGALTTRATLHNVSIIKQLELGVGDQITVYRSNMVIPKIDDNLTRSNTLEIPETCPCCGHEAIIKETDNSQVLMCTNPECPAKKVAQFENFVSRKCANIDGMSTATIQTLLDIDLINSFESIYTLKNHKDKLLTLPGFGTKSVENLLQSIENSRTIKLENFICALGIPNIGLSASKTISKACDGNLNKLIMMWANDFDFTSLTDFGDVIAKSFTDYFDEYINEIEALACHMKFIIPEIKAENSVDLGGKTICITGALNIYKNRDELVKDIEEHGGKVVSSVSKKTDMLLTNDSSSGSTKAKKATELGIPIVSEIDFRKMIGVE